MANDVITLNKHIKDKEIKNKKDKLINLTGMLDSGNLYNTTGKRYTVVHSKFKTDGSEIDRNFIIDKGIPCFQVNEWLDKVKINTQKKYTYTLCKFLNYLNNRECQYWEVDVNIVEDYINYLIYGGDCKILLMKSDLHYKSIFDASTVIKGFYKWMINRLRRIKLKDLSSNDYEIYRDYYEEISNYDFTKYIDGKLSLLPDSKEYLKWYEPEEIERIADNFNTLRDKAIFLCSIDTGFRIDEVFSTKLSTYSSIDKEISNTRSKTDFLRTSSISERTRKIIDNYMLTERSDAEVESNKFSEYLFINLRKGRNQGEALKYNDYYKIFKRCVIKAGFDPWIMRLHSSRSTKTMELLEYQSQHPGELTDQQIMTIMGWKSPDSINAYKNFRNKIIGVNNHKKIMEAREKRHGK